MLDNSDPDTSPLIFGEILFDHFLDGSRVLGGAPLNVAWHLQGLDLAPRMVSSVGADETGAEALDRMGRWGLDTLGVQVDPRHSTGRVMATLVDGEAAFEIGSGQAWDYIDPRGAASVVEGMTPAILYHGTLALRSDRSWQTVRTLETATGAPSFVDLNLRDPWWTPDRVRWCVETATWLKVNETELGVLVGEVATDREKCVGGARRLAEAHGLGGVFVTRGLQGAVAVAGDTVSEAPAMPLAPGELVDTVGAGDAFSAVACVGVLRGWSLDTTLERGTAFAADICRIRGALAEDRSLYDRHRAAWKTP